MRSKKTHTPEVEKLYDEMNYEKILWLGGFVKTTLSSALIGGGVTLFLAGINEYPIITQNPTYQLNVGLVAIIIGIIIVYLIDLKRREYKKEEITIYSQALNQKAQEIAEELVTKKLEQIEKETINKE